MTPSNAEVEAQLHELGHLPEVVLLVGEGKEEPVDLARLAQAREEAQVPPGLLVGGAAAELLEGLLPRRVERDADVFYLVVDAGELGPLLLGEARSVGDDAHLELGRGLVADVAQDRARRLADHDLAGGIDHHRRYIAQHGQHRLLDQLHQRLVLLLRGAPHLDAARRAGEVAAVVDREEELARPVNQDRTGVDRLAQNGLGHLGLERQLIVGHRLAIEVIAVLERAVEHAPPDVLRHGRVDDRLGAVRELADHGRQPVHAAHARGRDGARQAPFAVQEIDAREGMRADAGLEIFIVVADELAQMGRDLLPVPDQLERVPDRLKVNGAHARGPAELAVEHLGNLVDDALGLTHSSVMTGDRHHRRLRHDQGPVLALGREQRRDEAVQVDEAEEAVATLLDTRLAADVNGQAMDEILRLGGVQEVRLRHHQCQARRRTLRPQPAVEEARGLVGIELEPLAHAPQQDAVRGKAELLQAIRKDAEIVALDPRELGCTPRIEDPDGHAVGIMHVPGEMGPHLLEPGACADPSLPFVLSLVELRPELAHGGARPEQALLLLPRLLAREPRHEPPCRDIFRHELGRLFRVAERTHEIARHLQGEGKAEMGGAVIGGRVDRVAQQLPRTFEIVVAEERIDIGKCRGDVPQLRAQVRETR